MSDIKSQVQGLNPNVQARRIQNIIEPTGNVYEALAIMSKRANNLNTAIKHELQQKLLEFASVSESIEEIQENKEQIEISKFYERLPNPALIAMHEYLDHDLGWRYKDEDDDE